MVHLGLEARAHVGHRLGIVQQFLLHGLRDLGLTLAEVLQAVDIGDLGGGLELVVTVIQLGFERVLL